MLIIFYLYFLSRLFLGLLVKIVDLSNDIFEIVKIEEIIISPLAPLPPPSTGRAGAT